MWIVRLALTAAIHIRCDGAADSDPQPASSSCARRSISSRKSIFPSSASSGTSPACRRRTWRTASCRNTERGLTTTVNDIEHTESQSMNGVAIIKIFFQPHANLQTALAQVTAISQTQLRQLPPGTTPPLIIIYSASSVPIVQIGISSNSSAGTGAERSRSQLHAHAVDHRAGRGDSLPLWRQSSAWWPWISIPRHCRPTDCTPVDVVNAINAQNLILPVRHGQDRLAAIQRRDERQPGHHRRDQRPCRSRRRTAPLLTSAMWPTCATASRRRPTSCGRTGIAARLITVMKNGGASTLDIVADIKDMLPQLAPTLPRT